ncbi:MAG: alpha-L-fucosidase [Bilifractor sp.]|nr:alpha-L-fucosidase [Bilifractor sp.]
MKYEPTRESVTSHPVPQWYNDAKFGIFIHWGLFSVPGYAYSEKGKSIRDIHSETDEFEGQKYNPYAEWYLNSLRIEGSPTQDYHKKNYGADFSYFDFKNTFAKESRKMDPQIWAELFRKSGARYVVMVTKHHDGYCLWPSRYKNPYIADYQSERDLVGELTDAVRGEGLKMGLYYSGIFDWSFKKNPMNSPAKWLDHYLPSDQYAEYAFHQTEELIERYHPSVLWNDMGFPPQCDIDRLLADYYNAVPEGVTNERWIQRHIPKGMSLEEYADMLVKQGEIMRLDDGVHGDFLDPEYVDVNGIPDKKWEQTRGIGMSFGYNRFEDPANFLNGKDLIFMLADTVSKNGNLLINVGPMADGTIQKAQVQPLLETGEWLSVNGEAIYGTTWCTPQAGKTDTGKEVRYTRKGKSVYAIIMDDDPSGEISIDSVPFSGTGKLSIIGCGANIEGKVEASVLKCKIPEGVQGPAYVIKIE